jgi:hypothetical protein
VAAARQRRTGLVACGAGWVFGSMLGLTGSRGWGRAARLRAQGGGRSTGARGRTAEASSDDVAVWACGFFSSLSHLFLPFLASILFGFSLLFSLFHRLQVICDVGSEAVRRWRGYGGGVERIRWL